ncbi:hypothetical protein H0R92_00055 [Treponema sp. OMZ 840]|uniref:hypothetical protein n=1 Tax=Treponema sp. OMZ 840 TaxID=244313 RepID=UPI003D8CCA06
MKKVFDSLNPSLLFITSLLCLPGILFQQSLAYLWIDLVLFALLSALKKGRFRIVPPLAICFSIVFFNLFQADGYVLFSIFSLKVTSGSLQEGLKKSGVLLAMVFVSQYAVSRNLNLPGRTGGFLSRVFLYFDALSQKTDSERENDLQEKTGIKNKNAKKIKPFKAIGESVSLLMKKTDERLLNVFFSISENAESSASPENAENGIGGKACASTGKPPRAQRGGSRVAGLFISVLPLFPVYLLLILSYFGIFPV